MASAPTFHTTFLQLLDDVEGTFPELEGAVVALRATDAAAAEASFRAAWNAARLARLATRDATLFTDEAGCEIVGGLIIPARLWAEVDAATHTAIWNYLSSLALLSSANDESQWSEDDFKRAMEEMMKGLKTAGEAGGVGSEAANLFGSMGGLFEKLREMAQNLGTEGSAAAAGAEGGAADKPAFKLPERMFKGHIARMAREIAEEFKPEDFGIAPEMLETNDPTKIFEYLQEIFTKKPDLLMSAAQRIGRRIQTKFQRGEIRRDEIMAEIEELMKEFSENEAFNAIFGQLGEILQSSAKATGNEGSERRRQVQERLRKKAEAKRGGGSAGAAGAAGTAGASAAGASAAAVAAAEAAAAALLAEEAATGKNATGKKKSK